MKSPCLVLATLTLGGCAASYTEPVLPADHPASTAATEAPLPARAHTLDLSGAEPDAPAQGDAGIDHSGHNMGETAGSPGPAKDERGHQHDGGRKP
jgi:hypothetical protein